MSRLGTLRQVLRLLRTEADHRIWTALASTLLLAIASGILAALSPLALGRLVDEVTSTPHGAAAANGTSMAIAGTTYVLLLFGGRVLADIRPWLSGRIDQRLQARLTGRFFEHLLGLPMAYLLRRRSGELLHSLDLASAGYQLIVAHLVNSLLPVLVESVAMGVVLARLGQPALVPLFTLTAAIYLLIFATGALRVTKPANEASAASLEVYAQLSDGITNVETLRAFVAERQANNALRQANAALEGRWLRLHGLNAKVALAATAAFTLSMATCMSVASDAVAQGTLTVGGFLLVNVYVLQMVRPLEVLGSAARDLSRALGYVRPLLEILDEPEETACEPDLPSSMPGAPQTTLAPAIRFEQVCFGYEPQRPVLKGLTLDIQPGLTTAIVGRSGSGKSSLLRLLMRLYSPQSGRILLNGQSIENLPATRLRTLIGLIPQDTSLLHTSVAANISLGIPETGSEAIELAARRARLHEVISDLPLGYDTLVGERGLQLSGGERQRVAIARALLRNPALYLLDEPTSMLDSETEAGVLEALRELTADRTVIVIAHRLATVMQADEIVVLDEGCVLERGPHDALLAQGGLYAELWRQQQDGSS